MNVGVLNYSQPIGAKPSQFTDRDGADYLVRMMVAERISRKVIRLFDADSTFRQIRPIIGSTYIPRRLPARELPRHRYIPPNLRHKREVIVVGALTRIWLRELNARAAC